MDRGIMAQKPGSQSKPDLPPYFNIDPKQAAEKLSDPIDTARFAKAAAFRSAARTQTFVPNNVPLGHSISSSSISPSDSGACHVDEF